MHEHDRKKKKMNKAIVLFLILWTGIMGETEQSHAQGPDRLPLPSLSDAEQRGFADEEEITIADSLLSPNVLLFCGQPVNLDLTFRQRKLRRELASLAPLSEALMQRAEFFFPIVERILKKENIPDDFKYLMVVESGMNPDARSSAGALGLWQFMEGTARDYGLTVSMKRDERRDIERSTQAACRYLKASYKKFGDWVAVAQSYNIGQARINAELKRQDVNEAIDLQLVEETNRYIYRIMAAKIIFTHPKNFEIRQGIYYKKLRRK